MDVEKKALETIRQRSRQYGSFRKNCNLAMKFFFLNLNNINILDAKENDIHTIRYFIARLGAKLARLNFNPEHKDSEVDLLGYCKIYKKTCDYRIEFRALSVDDKGVLKHYKHKHFVELVNNELSKD